MSIDSWFCETNVGHIDQIKYIKSLTLKLIRPIGLLTIGPTQPTQKGQSQYIYIGLCMKGLNKIWLQYKKTCPWGAGG